MEKIVSRNNLLVPFWLVLALQASTFIIFKSIRLKQIKASNRLKRIGKMKIEA